MTSSLIRFAFVVAIVWLASSESRANAEEYVKSYSISARANVSVDTDIGGVRVMTSDTPQVEFRVSYEAAGHDDIHVDSRQNGDRVELILKRDKSSLFHWRSRSVSIEVHMPRNADLDLVTGDGAIEIASLNGHINARSGDGAINASRLSGSVDLSSGDGRINVDGAKGDLKVRTGDGGVHATGIDGKCDASSGDGRIEVAGRFDSLDVRSGDGDLSARAESGSSMSSGWSLRTGDGSIELTLPGDFKANLEVSTSDGHITSDLPITVQGTLGKSHLQGTLNGGGPALNIHTGDGSIRLGRT